LPSQRGGAEFTGTAFPPATKSISFGFNKPVFALIKKGGEGGKDQAWEVTKKGASTTATRTVGDISTSTDKEHTSEEEADKWIAAENALRRDEGYVDHVPEPASDAAPFASLFGGFAGNKEPEAPKFQGLFKSFGAGESKEGEEAKKDASSGEFKGFDMPKFGASTSSFGGGGSSLSFGAAGSTSLTSGLPTGGFTSLFGGGGAATEEKGDKASFNEAAASKNDDADLKGMLQETKKAQQAAAEDDKDKAPKSPKAVNKAVAELPDEVELKTGEEGEERVFTAQDVKLYVFCAEESKFKDRGRGMLHVNKNTTEGYTRVIMRRAITHTLGLNNRLWADMTCKAISDKEVRLSFTTSDDGGGIEMYSVRVIRPAGGGKDLAAAVEANKPSA